MSAPTTAEIEAARERLSGVARVTPVFSSETFTRLTGRDVVLKAENLQRTGSFKIRGATNTIATLSNGERAAGVVAASAGNHGQAVAWAARNAGIPATVFMPQDAPMAKIEAARSYGATIELGGEGFDEAAVGAQVFVEETGATLVHAFEDPRVIAGQGTIGLELAEQVPAAASVLIPVGGGGLAAGIALALRARAPAMRLIGVQTDSPTTTIADGIAVKHPGELTGSILGETLDELVTVGDDDVSRAIVLLAERAKLVVEGAGAVGIAALLAGACDAPGPAVVVLSGGNIDASTLLGVMRYGLTRGGRYLVLRTLISDRPGELLKLLRLIADHRGNIVSVDHHREGFNIGVAQTGVELTVVTRDEEHCAAIVGALQGAGYPVERLS